MTFCAKCTREYEPHKSEAGNPKRYCSIQCETEAKTSEKK